MRKWTTIVPVATAFAFSAALYSRLPESGHPNFSAIFPLRFSGGGGMPKTLAALLFPVVSLAAWVLINLLARVKKGARPLPQWWINENTGAAALKRFEPTFHTILFAVMSLFALVHVALLGSLLGWPAWSYRLLVVLYGLGLMAVGNVVPRTKPNWIIGLRTPRTLSDPIIWSRTHRIFGAAMVAAGFLVILCAIVAVRYAVVVAIGSLVVGALVAYIVGTRGAGQSSTAVA